VGFAYRLYLWTHLTVAIILLDNLSSVKLGSRAPKDSKRKILSKRTNIHVILVALTDAIKCAFACFFLSRLDLSFS